MPPKKKVSDTGQIINFYEHVPKKYLEEVDNPNKHLHEFELPFRMCIVAPSGSGKTNFLLNLIKVFSQGKGTFAERLQTLQLLHVIKMNRYTII